MQYDQLFDRTGTTDGAADTTAGFTVRSAAAPVVAALRGDLDAHSAPVLRRQMSTLEPFDTVVDVAGVTFCGVPGFTLLRDLATWLDEHDSVLRLARPSRSLDAMIRRLGLGTVLASDRTVVAAVAAIRHLRSQPAVARAAAL